MIKPLLQDDALLAGRRRMLFEMATGTGKTLTIAMLIKRWFQAAACSRVLFLADRIELAKQAKETFDENLRDHPSTLLFGGKRSLEGQIVVGTLDTIARQLGSSGFGHAYFDLVVTDECHRSIYNTHRATLGHFDAIHIDLTATPNRASRSKARRGRMKTSRSATGGAPLRAKTGSS